MKVHIQNFQSIEDVDFEINGLTVVVGKSNIGKSALRRAVQGALVNLKGDYFVTHGKQFTEVHLQTEDLDLLWKKGGPFNDYEINGVSYQNVGHGTPEAISEAGFRPLETNAGPLEVQIADQFRPLFLLQETGSLVAEAISDVGRLGDIQKALKACEKDRRAVKAKKKVREGDLVEAEEHRDAFSNLEADLEATNEVASLFKAIQALESEINILSSIEARKRGVEARITKFKPVQDVIIPDTEVIEAGVSTMAALESFYRRLQQASTVYKAVKGVEDVQIPDAEFGDRLTELSQLRSIGANLVKAGTVYKKLHTVGDVDLPTIDMDQQIGQLQRLEHLAKRHQQAGDVIPPLKSQVSNLETDIQKAQTEFHQVLHDVGQCPTCEQIVP